MALKSILKEVTLCLFSGKELSQAHCFAQKFALSYIQEVVYPQKHL